MTLKTRLKRANYFLTLLLFVGMSTLQAQEAKDSTAVSDSSAETGQVETSISTQAAPLSKDELKAQKKEAKYIEKWLKHMERADLYYQKGYYKTGSRILRFQEKKLSKRDTVPSRILGINQVSYAKLLSAKGKIMDGQAMLLKGLGTIDSSNNYPEFQNYALIQASEAYLEFGNSYRADQLAMLAENGILNEVENTDIIFLGDSLTELPFDVSDFAEKLQTQLENLSQTEFLKDHLYEAELASIESRFNMGYYSSLQKRVNHLAEMSSLYYEGNKKELKRKDRKAWEGRAAALLVLKGDMLRKKGDYQKAQLVYDDNFKKIKTLVGKRHEFMIRNQLGHALSIRGGNASSKEADSYLKYAWKKAKRSNDISKGSQLYYNIFEEKLALYKDEGRNKKYKKTSGKYKSTVLIKHQRKNPHFIRQQILDNNQTVFFESNPKKAERKSKRILKRSEGIFPETSTKLLPYHQQMFDIYVRQNRFDEAKKVLSEIESISAGNFGQESPRYHMHKLDQASYLVTFMNDFEAAEKIYDSSFQVVVSPELHAYHSAYSGYLNKLGELYEKTDRFDLAIDVLSKAKQVAEEKYGLSSTQYGTSLERLAGVYIQKGAYDQAEKLLEASVEIIKKEERRKSVSYVTSIKSLGELYLINGKYKESQALIEESVKLSKKLSDEAVDVPELGSMEEMVNLYITTGQFDDAEKMLTRSLKQKEEKFGARHYQLISPYSQFAELYLIKGDFIKAESNANKARDIALETRSDTSLKYIDALSLLGNIHKEMGREDDALANYEKALAGNRKIFGDNHINVANSLIEVADLELSMKKNPSEILPNIKEAQNIYKSKLGENHPDYARSLEFEAVTFIQQERLDEAIGLLVVAQGIYGEKFGNKSLEYNNNQVFLGDLYYFKKDYKEARDKYESALTVFKSVFSKYHPSYVGAEGKLARTYYANKEYSKSMEVLDNTTEKYLEYIETYFPSLSDKEKNLYWASIKGDFELYNSLAISYGSDKPKVLGKMYNNKLATKAILLNSSIKVRQNIMNSGDLELIYMYERWVGKKELLTRSIAMSNEEVQQKGINREQLQRDINILEKSLSSSSEAFAENKTELYNWQDVKKHLGENEYAMKIVRFNYFDTDFTDSVIYAALVVGPKTTKAPDLVILDNGTLLEGKYFKRFRNSIKYKIEDLKTYEHYWAKFDKIFNSGSTVFVSADGIFNQVNFETIKDRNGTYLIDKYNLVYVSNTKDIVIYRDKVEEEGKPEYLVSTAMLIGNPSFSSGNSTGKLNKANTVSSFDPLPGAEKEVNLLGDILDANKWSKESYIGAEATETRVKNMKSPRVFHVATHGFFVKDSEVEQTDLGANKVVDNPLLKSGLLFTGAAELLTDNNVYNFNKKDGILTAYEAMNLNLDHTELVVLSACETGLGEVKSGEGVYGLQRSFLVAGAQNVIMTLFKVDDLVTQELITSFYTEWLATGNKRAAFLKAKKQVKDKYEEPIYWGSFVMIGMD